MIKPTVGRVVLFTPAAMDDPRHDKTKPLAAMVAYVHGDRCVNLTVFDQNGNSIGGRSSVMLLQDGDVPYESGYYCEWMPYQKAVAAGEIAPTKHAT